MIEVGEHDVIMVGSDFVIEGDRSNNVSNRIVKIPCCGRPGPRQGWHNVGSNRSLKSSQ